SGRADATTRLAIMPCQPNPADLPGQRHRPTSGTPQVSHRAPRPILIEVELSRTLDLAASARRPRATHAARLG
ncbi:MAG: hypothetical protein M3460_26600, partial [Actinomycetota bacterium]|nr:hypothetical protein [Actinomycetota bacterium]